MKWTVALSACCVVLLAANIALIHQNSQLKAQLSLPPPVMEAAAGAQVPDLRGVDLEGKPVEVLYGKDSRKVLVMVFSPTCPFCDQNWPKWQQVISSLNRSAVRPVLVDVTSTTTTSFVSQHQLSSLPVILKADPRATMDYHMHLTPQTILVDPNGKVEKVWTGVLNDAYLADLKRHLADTKTTVNAQGHQPNL
jgi:peroxiredoxin